MMLLLGIPFHVGEIYRVSGGFFLDSPDSSYVASLLRPGVMPLNPIVEMAIISLFTVAGCLLVYELARRVPILAWPLNGGPFKFATGWKLAPKRIA